MKLINLDNGQVLAEKVHMANTFFKRLKGLMFSKNLPSDCALYIQPCRGIHTFFMRYSIDVLHLDSFGKVVAIEENVQPGRIGKVHPHTMEIIELPAGKIEKNQTKLGNTIQLSKKQM
ncbi:DUF192 domain-containing protein [Anaeromicrobium sediminis]|uniref:DUF192 domain-containing protein n=1 Tax=Anaeromicrobium sediminis TaxID=1478221 RepID=A0A267MFY2_9FIRM|nr:DUF192 domain-containing protein [Anaeromicrobium sediminis]PAB58377.1 hypothetical protein CCE28_15680 [Anaeromicrobium sediminis]